MDDATKIKYELKKTLAHLRGMHGSGTELISVYIPAKGAIHEMSGKLNEEAGQATNIKSKSTRTNVGMALAKIIHHLKTYGHTAPESGVAVFCGNISDNQSKSDIQLFTVYPSEPITVQIYRCDSRFFLEPLERMVDVKDTYGLVVLDGRECTLATLRGTNINILHRLNSTAHAKIRKGGQSARRYERLIEESIELYYKRVGEYMDRYYVNSVKGVIIGGPGPTKENFVKMKPFNYQIKVLGVVDTGYTEETGLRELMGKSGDIIGEQEAIKERVLIDRFMHEVVSGGLAIYGEANVREALLSGKAGTLLVSEGLKYSRVRTSCNSCKDEKGTNLKEGAANPDTCEKCGGRLSIVSKVDLIDDLMALAEKGGIKIEIVSEDTSEGAQFLQSFYGVGAFVRYR
jgi:peptide chain release factor subunit 1